MFLSTGCITYNIQNILRVECKDNSREVLFWGTFDHTPILQKYLDNEYKNEKQKLDQVLLSYSFFKTSNSSYFNLDQFQIIDFQETKKSIIATTDLVHCFSDEIDPKPILYYIGENEYERLKQKLDSRLGACGFMKTRELKYINIKNIESIWFDYKHTRCMISNTNNRELDTIVFDDQLQLKTYEQNILSRFPIQQLPFLE